MAVWLWITLVITKINSFILSISVLSYKGNVIPIRHLVIEFSSQWVLGRNVTRPCKLYFAVNNMIELPSFEPCTPSRYFGMTFIVLLPYLVSSELLIMRLHRYIVLYVQHIYLLVVSMMRHPLFCQIVILLNIWWASYTSTHVVMLNLVTCVLLQRIKIWNLRMQHCLSIVIL